MASVSNGKRHVIKRKQTREKVCDLCLNANSCNMQNQNKYFRNSQSLPPPPLFQLNFRHCICVAIFIILESQSEMLWHQNYKLRPQNYKLAHKTTSYAYKTTVTLTKLQVTPTKLQVTSSKLTSLTAETNKFQLTDTLSITF